MCPARCRPPVRRRPPRIAIPVPVPGPKVMLDSGTVRVAGTRPFAPAVILVARCGAVADHGGSGMGIIVPGKGAAGQCRRGLRQAQVWPCTP